MNPGLRNRISTTVPASDNDLDPFRDEMGRAFERFFTASVGHRVERVRSQRWTPALEVGETESDMLVRAEVPGIPPEDIEISFADRALIIAGRKSERSERQEDGDVRYERRFGCFQRVIILPECMDAGGITAEADAGVVTVRVPKKPRVKPQEIEGKPVSGRVPISE